ncbi:hypothetical protein BDL97_04G128200 [Sphagnum fallax]|nr:hypothetical protein BDL97_04G128200 [Sphagnum fallax]
MRSESDSPSEGLLPQPLADSVRDEEKRRRWVSDLKTVAICVLLLSDLVALWYYSSTSLQFVKAPASTVSWTAAAVRAAEAAAMNSCSGHGSVFMDTVLVGSDGAQICECHECFTGPDCALLIPDCAVEADSGDPLLFEEYWMQHPDLGTVVIPGWYRMSYQTCDAGTLADYCTDALKAAIQDLHALTGNAVTKGRYIVLGTGSTQLINAAVHSIALQQKEVSNVVASVPYYQAYRLQTQLFSSPNYQWAGDPERDSSSFEGSDAPVIELMASPNNPTATIQEVPSNASGVVVYDYAYYWPHLTPITKAVNADVMLFTLSKITGHAGTRIGWAIVKDLDLYYKMLNYIFFNTAGVSHDSQLRATHLIRTVVNSYTNPPTMSREKGIFHYGQEVLLARWERLQGIFSNSSRFSLQHIETQHCSFFGKKSPPSPGSHTEHGWSCSNMPDMICELEQDMHGSIVNMKRIQTATHLCLVQISLGEQVLFLDQLTDMCV